MKNKAQESAEFLADLILRAAEFRENSYDHKTLAENRKLNPKAYIGTDYYQKTMREACVEACGKEGSMFVEVLHSMLFCSWNESIEWAQDIAGRKLAIIGPKGE